MTRNDVRKLINEELIKEKQKRSNSRGRARAVIKQKRKNRRKGKGSRKGKSTSRLPRKESWILKIRSQRKFINELKKQGNILPKTYTMLRKKAKGGFFRSRRHISLFIKEKNLEKEHGT